MKIINLFRFGILPPETLLPNPNTNPNPYDNRSLNSCLFHKITLN